MAYAIIELFDGIRHSYISINVSCRGNIRSSYSEQYSTFKNAYGGFTGRQLKTYFPEIWDREELLKELQKKRELSTMFHKWEQRHQEEYLHYFSQQSDTGLEMELLQKFLFVPLDIFHENQQNKIIKNKLDAWLLFLSSDEPEDILRLCDEYPEFRAMYKEAYQICRNLEDVMGFFSEELRILDRNTVQYMMDEMQAEIDEKRKVLETTQGQLETTQGQLETTQGQLETTQGQLETTQGQLEMTQEELKETKKQLADKEMLLQKLESRVEELEKKILVFMQ